MVPAESRSANQISRRRCWPEVKIKKGKERTLRFLAKPFSFTALETKKDRSARHPNGRGKKPGVPSRQRQKQNGKTDAQPGRGKEDKDHRSLGLWEEREENNVITKVKKRITDKVFEKGEQDEAICTEPSKFH